MAYRKPIVTGLSTYDTCPLDDEGYNDTDFAVKKGENGRIDAERSADKSYFFLSPIFCDREMVSSVEKADIQGAFERKESVTKISFALFLWAFVGD